MAISTAELNKIYQEELGRPAAAEGINYWTQGGTSLSSAADIRKAISESQESKAYKSSKSAPASNSTSASTSTSTSASASAPKTRTTQLPGGTYVTQDSSGRQQVLQKVNGGIKYIYADTPEGKSLLQADAEKAKQSQSASAPVIPPQPETTDTFPTSSAPTAKSIDQIVQEQTNKYLSTATGTGANQKVDAINAIIRSGLPSADINRAVQQFNSSIKDVGMRDQASSAYEKAMQTYSETGQKGKAIADIMNSGLGVMDRSAALDRLNSEILLKEYENRDANLEKALLNPSSMEDYSLLNDYRTGTGLYAPNIQQEIEKAQEIVGRAPVTTSSTADQMDDFIYRWDIDPTADLDSVYRNVLGRTIGDEGRDFWRSEIDKAVASGTPYKTALNNAIVAIQSSEEATNFATTGVARSDVPGSNPVAKKVDSQPVTSSDATVNAALEIAQAQYDSGQPMSIALNAALTSGSLTANQQIEVIKKIRDVMYAERPTTFTPVQPSAIQSELDAIYRSVLGPNRGIQQEGLEYFTNDYNTYRQQGQTHEQALANIRNSVEQSAERDIYEGQVAQINNTLNSIYRSLLGRDIGRDGLDYFVNDYNNYIAQGMNPTQAFDAIRNSIMASDEYQIYQQTNVPYVVPDDQRVDFNLPSIPTPNGQIQDQMVQRAVTPAVPVGGAMQPAQIAQTPEQTIGAGVGQVGAAPKATMQTAGTTAQAMAPTMQPAAQVTAQDATPNVSDALQQVAPAQGSVSTNAQVQAAQMSPTATEVGTVGAAQIAEAQQVQQPQSRTLQEGELVTAAANAQQAAAFAEQVGAATADPTSKATVQGQLADLMTQFEGGEIPAWAAGAMRQANATLAARGLGASSIAGQAVVQAAMEASLPIASADAATVAQFELTNLSNRQQRAMLAAQQRAQFIGQEFDQQFQARVSNAARIADIANINFNAEQQVALENARLAQSVDLANLQNTQALVMAEAAQIANIETTNLNNRQQAAVQNAQSFLQMDLTNLSNQQQTDMFKAQSVVQSLLSDQAAENAARQFNASSENQTNQFFANLNAQISQYNATQNNAMSQFNAEQSNVVNRFNAELQAQRDQFNAQNQLVIEQSNAQWRRELATADTAAQNLANQFNAQAILDISNTAYAQLWQSYRDDMEFAWTSGENERDRLAQLALQKLQVDASKYAADAKEDGSFASALGSFAATVVSNW